MTGRLSNATVLLLGLVAGCRSGSADTPGTPDSAALEARAARLDQALASPDSASNAPVARWVMPPALAEISGMALTSDQRLLVHNDESARVFEVDYRRGVVVKSFQVGPQTIRDDFEAIATLGERIFLLASGGRIYEFREGDNGSRVRHRLHDTGLGSDCEFEGLAVDSAANALILACKNILVEDVDDVVLFYRVPLDSGSSRGTVVRVAEDQAIGANPWKGFTPSDLTIDPASGDYVVVSAQQKALMRLKPDGTVVWSRPLPPGHEMAEGIAITKDGLLIVSDESASKRLPAAITVYPWP